MKLIGFLLCECFFFQKCVDIDECAEHSGACVHNSVCINTVVSKLSKIAYKFKSARIGKSSRGAIRDETKLTALFYRDRSSVASVKLDLWVIRLQAVLQEGRVNLWAITPVM